MKRFYDEVGVREGTDGYQVTLDGRGLKTVKGQPQIVPTRALAKALAEEWEGQGEDMDLDRFEHRDMADYAIDVVAADRGAAIEGLLSFAETDTLCYRADPEEPLFRRQQDAWEPVLARFEAREGVQLQRISGVIHRAQDEAVMTRLRGRLARLDHFALAGLQAMASLAASLCIALEALEPDADAPALWDAASLEEEWQAGVWGRDKEAEARREKRRAAFLSAHAFVQLARQGARAAA